MTILSIKEIPILPSGKYKHREILLKCDECGIEYTRPHSKNRDLKSELHFCSKRCSDKSITDGALRQKSVNTMNVKYGSSYVKTKKFKVEREETFLRKYGVKSILNSPEIKQKIRKSNLEKYGQEVYAGSDDWESKLDRIEIARKAWLTKIENGTCSKSAPEEKLFLLLESVFGKSDIKRQVRVIRRWIDFYIISIDLYIQVDGVYWHGLNRNIELIKLGKTSQDRKIYKQILRDQKLNQYMKDNNFRLVRLTDEQIKTYLPEDIIAILKGT
jgi:hypothetical protein